MGFYKKPAMPFFLIETINIKPAMPVLLETKFFKKNGESPSLLTPK